MNALAHSNFSERLPNKVEVKNAEHLRELLAKLIEKDKNTTIPLVPAKGETRNITLSPALAHTLLEVLRLIASGQGFRLIPVQAQLTTQQAADLLNVSRPYLIKLLEGKEIAYTKIGRHRRIKAEDLFAYKAKRDEIRRIALSEMAALDAELGLI